MLYKNRYVLRWVIVAASVCVGVVIGLAVSSADSLRYQRELATDGGVTDWSETIQWGVVANPGAYGGGFVGAIVGAVAGRLLSRRCIAKR